MYVFKEQKQAEETLYKKFLAENPPTELYVFNYLNGESDASRDIRVPPGVIHKVHVFAADTETDHEDVGWQIWLDNVIIYPTSVEGNAGWEIPIAGAGAHQTYTLNYRVLHDSILSGAINGIGNLTSGMTIVVEYMVFDVTRQFKKGGEDA